MSVRSAEVDSLWSWAVAAVGFLGLFTIWGAVFSFTVYADALRGEFGLHSVAVSTLYSVELFGFYIVGGGVTGLVISRVRTRSVFLLATVIIVACIAAFQVISNYVLLLIIFFLLGSSLGTMLVITISIVPLWFNADQGFAMGVTVAGNGLGILILSPVLRSLVTSVGVRQMYLALSPLFVVSFLTAAAILQRPQSLQPQSGSAGSGIEIAWLRTTLISSRFWLAFVGTGLLFLWYFVLSDHLVDALISRGISGVRASALFGLIGGLSILFRVVSGYIADRIGARRVIAGCAILVTIGLTTLANLSGTLIYVPTVLFSIGLGGISALYAPVLINAFDVRNSPAVMGLFNLSHGVIGLLAPVSATLVVELTGGYSALFLIASLLTLLGAVTFWKGTGCRETDPDHFS